MDFDISPLFVSAKTVFLSTLIVFFLGISLAWFMNTKNYKLNIILDSLITLPMILPPTVVGFFLLLFFGKNSPLGNFLYSIGIKIIFSWFATVIAAIVVSFPLMYKTTLAAFQQIDKTLLDVARTLGVSELRIFLTIVLPLSWPSIVAGTVLSGARALGEFGATLMIAGNIPGKTQTIPLAIFFAVESGNMNIAFFWVLIIFSFSLVTIFISNYWSGKNKRRLEEIK